MAGSLQGYCDQRHAGLANFYQIIIKNMHNLSRTPECQAAFDLSFTHYDPKLDIIVASDASSNGIGACILHKLPDGIRKAIVHASRSVLPAEHQYSQIEKQALGIIFAVTKFHRYLYGRRFTQQRDHKPLLSIFGSKNGQPVYTANRLLRLGTILLNYHFQIEYLSSKNICHANRLSWLVSKNTEVFEDSIIATLRTYCEIKNMVADTIRELSVTLADIKREALKDDFIHTTKNNISIKDPNVPEVFHFATMSLYITTKWWYWAVSRKKILWDFHMGHPGRKPH